MAILMSCGRLQFLTSRISPAAGCGMRARQAQHHPGGSKGHRHCAHHNRRSASRRSIGATAGAVKPSWRRLGHRIRAVRRAA